MSYEPKLRPNAQAKITAYLEETYKDRESYLRAVDEIRLALLNLAANPRQASSPPGPFESRPIYRFPFTLATFAAMYRSASATTRMTRRNESSSLPISCRLGLSALHWLLVAQPLPVGTLNRRARAIIAPVTPADAERAKVESFLSVELLRRVYEEYKEGTLPSEVGLRNLLETRYQVLKDRAGPAVKVMKESAAEAGFFRVSSDRMVKPILSGKGAVHSTPESRHDHGPEQKPRHGGAVRMGV